MAVLDPIRAARTIHKLYQPSIPVRPECLAKEMGLTVVGAKLSEHLSGVLVPEIDGNRHLYMIVVNTQHPKERQRFSIAHELGHFCLHRDLQPAFLHHAKHRNRLEREADKFAAELLMPEHDVRIAATIFRDLDALVNLFAVSRLAMRRRLKELDIKAGKDAIA